MNLASNSDIQIEQVIILLNLFLITRGIYYLNKCFQDIFPWHAFAMSQAPWHCTQLPDYPKELRGFITQWWFSLFWNFIHHLYKVVPRLTFASWVSIFSKLKDWIFLIGWTSRSKKKSSLNRLQNTNLDQNT